MVTVESFRNVGKKTFFIRATQEYMPAVDMGHWKLYILDESDNKSTHILKIQSSICCPPKGKIDQKFLQEEMEKFLQEYKQDQSFLKRQK